MYRTEIKEGVSAIKQGELGDNLYVVESGTFNVFVNQKQVATRGKGTCFGELALMYNSPRAATVTAATHCVVWVVDRFTFRRIVTDLSEKRFGVYVGFLKKVELLMPLAEYERKKIAEALEETTISAATTVMVSDSLYTTRDLNAAMHRLSHVDRDRERDTVPASGAAQKSAAASSAPPIDWSTSETQSQCKLRSEFSLLLLSVVVCADSSVPETWETRCTWSTPVS
jgi:CRP-like cAMP-binding protein